MTQDDRTAATMLASDVLQRGDELSKKLMGELGPLSTSDAMSLAIAHLSVAIALMKATGATQDDAHGALANYWIARDVSVVRVTESTP